MKNKYLIHKKSMVILAVLLLMASFGIFILLVGSSHGINIYNFETQVTLGLIALYAITGCILLTYINFDNEYLKWILILFLFLVIISLMYLVYVVRQVKFDDYAVLIPIGIFMLIIILNIRILYFLIKNSATR